MSNQHVTFRIERGANQAAREWAARLVAARCGFPFRVATPAGGREPREGPCVSYGTTRRTAGVTIRPSGYFDGGIETADRAAGQAAGELAGVPVPFGGRGVERSGTSTVMNADILASSFFLANRIEEISAARLDEHGRFPAASSFMGRNGLLQKPLIDLWAAELARELARLYPNLERKRPWPAGGFAVCVTHDIETLAPINRPAYLAHRLGAAVKSAAHRHLAGTARNLYAGLSRAVTGRTPSWSFCHLRAGERPAPGTYFFMGGATSPMDGTYDVEEDRVRGVMRELVGEGCEVGVHLGYDTGCRVDSMLAQKSKVAAAAGAPVRGARHHYLCARFPEVWKAHEEARFEYDATLGFAEKCGFRGGTALPYRPFDVREGRTLELFEVPLAAMDGTFFQYRGLRAEETTEAVLSLARNTAEVAGVFTLLWHNTMVDPLDKPRESRAYFEITAALRRMEGWWTTLGGCVGRWKEYLASLEV